MGLASKLLRALIAMQMMCGVFVVFGVNGGVDEEFIGLQCFGVERFAWVMVGATGTVEAMLERGACIVSVKWHFLTVAVPVRSDKNNKKV